MAKIPKRQPGPPMTLANMRRQGVRKLIAYCLNDSCRHQALIDVSAYPDNVEVPSFQRRIKCGECGGQAGGRQTQLEGKARHARQLGRALGLGKVMAASVEALAYDAQIRTMYR